MIGRYRSGNPLDRVRGEQPVAVALVSVDRPGPRARPALARPRPHAGECGDRQPGSVVRSDRLRASAAAGTFGNSGARAPSPAPTFAPSTCPSFASSRSRPSPSAGRLEFRVEAFNIFDRANFGVPSLLAFTGSADNEAPLTTFGRIRTTVTSARQIQLGIRATF